MTTWYVRPDTSHSATRDGKSYATAWGGWSAIAWSGAGIKAGDTLYICGAHAAAATWTVGFHGSVVGSPLIIRGDYEQDPGSVVFTGSAWLFCNRDYTTIRGLTITAGTAYCIYLYGAPLTGTTIQGCTLNGGPTLQIINIHGADTLAYVDLLFDNNTFSGGNSTNVGSAIHWLATGSLASARYITRVSVTNNEFTNCSSNRSTVAFRIASTEPGTCKITDLIVTGNTFRDCSGVAVEAYVEEFGRNTGVRITDNTIYNQTNKPLAMGGAFSLAGFADSTTPGFGPNIIARNKAYGLAGPTGFSNPFYGAYTYYDNYAEDISTDTIDGCGILFDHGCDGCVAYGNHFKRITGTGADGYYSGGFGFLVLDAINITIYGNVVDGCVTGVAFGNEDAGQSSNVFNNTFRNCSQSGAFVGGWASTTTNLVRNNIFTATRSIPSVKNDAATWTGEAHNCFHSFGATSGHTLAASTVTIDPDLDDDYRPRAAYIKVGGTYLGETDFYGNQFSSPAPMGAVNDEAIIALSDPQQTELQKAVTRPVYFVQLEFASSTQYLCTANITLTWGGHDWLGFGTVGGISPIEESEGVESRALTFTLNVAQQSVLALAVGVVEEYRGRVAKMYFCPLDESFQLVGTPQLCWRGIMDLMAIGVEGEEGKITLKCETSAYGLKRQPNLRLNSAQHKKTHPNDTGFDYLNDLIANPTVWLSKKFQRSIN